MDLTWEERHPRSYKALLRKVRGVADLEALRDLGKKVYTLNLARDQAWVFWYEYGKSRNQLMVGLRKGLGGSARHLLKQIQNVNGDLAALGAMPCLPDSAGGCEAERSPGEARMDHHLGGLS